MAHVAGGELARVIAADAPRHTIFIAVLDLLSRPPVTVAVIEDVHWADEATLDLLLYLGRRIADTHAMVIAAFREDEVGRGHPLRVVLGDLATTRSVHRLAVPPLTRAGVAELATSAGFEPDHLYAVTGGNPFFVTEVLATPDQAVPPNVRDAVLARAARLSPTARAALDVAAAIPDHAELHVLRAASGTDRMALDECVEAGVLVADGRGLRFRHELARVVVEQAVPAMHRLASTPGCWLTWPANRTWTRLGWPTMPARRTTAPRYCATPRPPRPTRLRWGLIAKRPPTTPARCVTPLTWRRSGAPGCGSCSPASTAGSARRPGQSTPRRERWRCGARSVIGGGRASCWRAGPGICGRQGWSLMPTRRPRTPWRWWRTCRADPARRSSTAIWR